MIRKLTLKNNKFNRPGRTKAIQKIDASLYENSTWKILRNPMSSMADLQKLAKRLNLNITFDWIDNYKRGIDSQILNIDSDHIGGTHWIAIYKDTYFDPIGLPIARDNLNFLQYSYIPVQDYTQGGCGLYCILFIWYAVRDDIDGFYSLF